MWKKAMVTAAVLGTALCLDMAGGSAAFAASPNAANMEQFVEKPTPTCEGPVSGTGTPSGSFAIIKDNASGVVTAEVSLKDAAPDATYQAVIQTNPGCEFSAIGDITTNGQGNGNASLSFTDPTATQALVYVFQENGSDIMQTPLYTFGSK